MGITELTVAVLPWLATMLIFLVMVTYIPAISLWLPHLFGHALTSPSFAPAEADFRTLGKPMAQLPVVPASASLIFSRETQGACAMGPHPFLQRLGIEHPVLLAPMAGAGGTPELAAAVSNAGGLGAWGGAYAKPEEIVGAIRRIRQLTQRAFQHQSVCRRV